MKQENEHPDLIWEPQDTRKVKYMAGFIFLIISAWITFLLITLAPSCPNKSPEYYYQQGKIESAKTNSYVAIKYFSKAIKLKPDYLEAYLDRASVYLSLDSIKRAITDYDSALVMKNINVQQKGEYTYLKAYAYYLLNGYDSTYCRLVNEACDRYGDNKSCDERRLYCK